MMINRNKQNGFSLVELSVVLSVIGVTLGGALTLATKKTEGDKLEETQNKIEKIEMAMDSFLNENKRLPCPASGSLASNNLAFGVEGAASTGGCASANFSSSNTYSGVVPTKTLGLPDEIMIDGWDRRISYAIDYRFANNITTNSDCDGTTSTVCFKYTSDGSIRINDSAGNSRTTTAVFTIISHGKNGKGAWKYVGSATRLPASSDSDEQNNAGDDLSSTFDAIFVQKETDATFDDIVSYRSKWQLVDDVDGITDAGLCDLAEDDPATNVCTGATSTTVCGNLASQISQFCY